MAAVDSSYRIQQPVHTYNYDSSYKKQKPKGK